MRRVAGGLLLLLGGVWALREGGGDTSPAPREAPSAEERTVLRRGGSAPAPSPYVESDTWLTDRVLVLARDPEAVARRLDTEVLGRPGPSGWTALAVPRGVDRADLLDALADDPDVDDAAPMARTFGATHTGDRATPATAHHQWHLAATKAGGVVTDGLEDVVVAVLDTGVAWSECVHEGRRHARAPSLRKVRFVAPWDYIHDDPHPDDDHQHGTHIASLIASNADVRGIAPGVSIMPVKVLDEDDVGTELALVDGILHAVSNGADVVNMSLSFGAGYVPSRALTDALERAAQAGAVLVSAAGNEGLGTVTQPAANPLVVAVGAVRPSEDGRFVPTSYSNASPRVDLVAPGGSVDADRNGDGYLDGLLAETIALHEPSRVGYWLYAGTSQAAALVSGAAAHLLARGHTAEEVRVLLQAGAATQPNTRPWVDGHGRGLLDLAGTLARASAGDEPRPRDYFVSVLAWLVPGPGGTVRPSARLTVIEEDGALADGVAVAGTLDGAGGGPFRCVVEDGSCRVDGALRSPEAGESWVFSVDAVISEGVAFRPGAAMFANTGLHALARELRENTALWGSVLSFHWTPREDPWLGAVAESHLLVNLGVGRATSPMAMIMTPTVLSDTWQLAGGSLRISGTADSPAVRAGLPLGGAPRWRLFRIPDPRDPAIGLRIFSVDDADLGPTALGVTATRVHAGGTGWRPVLVGTGYSPGPIVANRAAGQDLANTPLGSWLRGGGFVTGRGEPAATAMVGTGLVPIRGR
ncbi:MAG: S8 family serine peptidase [Myxococcota bacterium]